MAPDSSTSIRVFVRWEEQNVFAGEDVKCSIIFRNVARLPGPPSRDRNGVNGAASRPGPGLDRQRQRQLSSQTLAQARANNGSTLAPPLSGPGRGHRASMSMSNPSSSPRARSGSGLWTATSSPSDAPSSRNGHTHRRSISIVSLGSASTIDEPTQLLSNLPQKTQRPGRGHTRSASLQIMSRGPLVNGPRSGWCLL
jgi:RAB6A-GEF complex partner protein 2